MLFQLLTLVVYFPHPLIVPRLDAAVLYQDHQHILAGSAGLEREADGVDCAWLSHGTEFLHTLSVRTQRNLHLKK